MSHSPDARSFNTGLVGLVVVVILMFAAAKVIGATRDTKPAEPESTSIGNGITKTIDREHGNVCYRAGYGVSCVPLREEPKT